MCVALFAFELLLYYAATAVAKDLGLVVCTAFDLYRNDLRKALCLPFLTDENLDEEKQLWHSISRFIKWGKHENFEGFVYSEPLKEKSEWR